MKFFIFILSKHILKCILYHWSQNMFSSTVLFNISYKLRTLIRSIQRNKDVTRCLWPYIGFDPFRSVCSPAATRTIFTQSKRRWWIMEYLTLTASTSKSTTASKNSVPPVHAFLFGPSWSTRVQFGVLWSVSIYSPSWIWELTLKNELRARC